MSHSITEDSDGDTISETTSTNTVTVGFARKVGRENYGNEEASIFFQVDILPEDDLEAIEQKVRATYAFAKGIVYGELGVATHVQDDGVVRDAVEADKKPAPKARGGKPAAKPAANGTGADSATLWQQWLDAPQEWWDNRDGKRNPKAPDFKHKETGDALWINSREPLPEAVKIALGFDADVI